MDETTLPRSQDVNFLAVICQTNVPGDLLLRVFCFDEETQLDEVESFFSEHSVLSRGEGSSIQSVSWGAAIQVTIYGHEVPTKQYGVKLRYLKGQVFQDTSLIVCNVVNCIPQLMFTLVQSAEILSIVTLAPIEKTSKVTASVEMQASPVVKQGVPSHDELEGLSANIGNKWKPLGRRLGFLFHELEWIDVENKFLSQKAYKMLKEWKNKNGSGATYKTLYAALSHRFISREDLAEKYFKQRVPSHDELEDLSANLGSKWEQLGLRLNFSIEELQEIDLDERLLYKKALQMLKKWKCRNGSNAAYQTLYAALSHRDVSHKDLAEKYIKQGLPSHDELEELSTNIGSKWEQLGRRLGFSGEELDRIDMDKRLPSQKANQMLKEWKNRNGSDATYETLCAALSHRFISCKDLAEKYIKQDLPSHDELEDLSTNIGSKWKQLGCKLSFSHQELQEIDLDERHLSWKAHEMLKEWKSRNGPKATHQTLHAALSHRSVLLEDLAEKFWFHSTEVEQGEESGSAAKIHRLDPIMEPGTSGVSSPSKKKKIMKEEPISDDDLQTLGKAIGNKWDRLARRLKIKEEEIEEIDEQYRTLSQRGHQMLKLWKTNNNEAADYKTLYDALVHNMVQRKDLAEKYCYK